MDRVYAMEDSTWREDLKRKQDDAKQQGRTVPTGPNDHACI